MEEKFFFLYQMKLWPEACMRLPVNERKWMIRRFTVQKNRESEAIEAERRKARNKSGK
jgi:hypothetical protein